MWGAAEEAASTAVEGDIAVAEPEASQEESDAAVKAVLSGTVAVVAFQQACKELPKKVSVYARFLDVLEPFTFPGTEKIAEVNCVSRNSPHRCHKRSVAP